MTMTDQPAVSVIMPARDCLRWLPRSTASVLTQSRRDLELIVLDDASRDGSWEWLQTAAAGDPRLRPVRLAGVGASRARNHALPLARAELVAFLDADDSWRPGKLERQLAFHAAHPKVVLSFTDYLHVDPEGGTHGTCYGFWPRIGRRMRGRDDFVRLADGAATILAENPVGTSTVVARRDALRGIGGFDPSLPSASDWDVWLRLAGNGPVGASGTVLADYLMRPGSISGDRAKRLAAMRTILDRHAPSIRSAAPDAVRAARSRLAVAEAEIARERGEYRRAATAHLRALGLVPSLRVARAAASDLAQLLTPRGARLS
jgi:glycosyltransferase involved in cell wall biosynthesis